MYYQLLPPVFCLGNVIEQEGVCYNICALEVWFAYLGCTVRSKDSSYQHLAEISPNGVKLTAGDNDHLSKEIWGDLADSTQLMGLDDNVPYKLTRLVTRLYFTGLSMPYSLKLSGYMIWFLTALYIYILGNIIPSP